MIWHMLAAGFWCGLGYCLGCLVSWRTEQRVRAALLRPLPGFWRSRALRAASHLR